MNPLVEVCLLAALLTPAPSAEGAALIPLLGSNVFAYRECAAHRLRMLSHAAEGDLAWAAWHHDCPEVRQRAERLLAELDDEMVCLDDPRGGVPWIDMLHADTPDRCALQQHYLERAHEQGVESTGCPDWLDYRVATLLYLRDLRKAGMPAARRKDLLASMRVREQKYRSKMAARMPTEAH